MKIFLLAVALTFIFGGYAAHAQTDATDCPITAWVTSTDPKGLNVRFTPNGKVIGKIPYSKDDDEIAMVEIVDYSKGWVRIAQATTVSGTIVFQGRGWISAKMVTINTQRPDGNSSKPVTLYIQPVKHARIAGKIPSDVNVRIIGYDCFFLKVAYKGKVGWLSTMDICGNPVTTCS